MSTAHSHDNMIPSGAIKLAVGLVGASLVLVLAVRADWLAPSTTPGQYRAETRVRPVAERLLSFADVGGDVQVTDVRSGAVIASFGQEGSGFIRGVMRGLARERRMYRLGAEPPFRLTRYADSQLTLTDTATGRVIELSGFGATNRAAFASLLKAQP